MRATGRNKFEFVEYPVTVEFSDFNSGISNQVVLQLPLEKKLKTFRRSSPYEPSRVELEEFAGAYSIEEVGVTYHLEAAEENLVLHRLKAKPDKLEPLVQKRFSGSIGIIRFERSTRHF